MMKHSLFVGIRHSSAEPTPDVDIQPLSLDYPGDAYIRDEINRNRKKERWLILYGSISLVLVAILITIRLLFF
jgi:hypothetical protein